jgi:hypothetical protein
VVTHFDLSPRNLILDGGNRLWLIDFQLSGFYPQWFEYAGVLSTWGNIKYCEWIAAFAAGNYWKQYLFLLNVDWAVHTGHLIQGIRLNSLWLHLWRHGRHGSPPPKPRVPDKQPPWKGDSPITHTADNDRRRTNNTAI